MKAKEMRKTRRIGLSTLTVALLGVAAAVFVIVGAFSFVAVYGQAMTADTSTRASRQRGRPQPRLKIICTIWKKSWTVSLPRSRTRA